MHHQNRTLSLCLAGASLSLCAPAFAGDDAAAICKAAVNAYEAGIASGDPAKLAAVYAPDGQLVSPWGVVTGHAALVKTFASFIKPGDKDVDTLTSSRMIGEVALCSGDYTFTPASGGAAMKGYWTKVLGKVGDDWKLHVLTYNVAPPQ